MKSWKFIKFIILILLKVLCVIYMSIDYEDGEFYAIFSNICLKTHSGAYVDDTMQYSRVIGDHSKYLFICYNSFITTLSLGWFYLENYNL